MILDETRCTLCARRGTSMHNSSINNIIIYYLCIYKLEVSREREERERRDEEIRGKKGKEAHSPSDKIHMSTPRRIEIIIPLTRRDTKKEKEKKKNALCNYDF